MSEVEIKRRRREIEFSAPSNKGSVRDYDDGREWLTVTGLAGGLEVAMLDNGAGGEYGRSWCDILLDREAVLKLREFIDEWLDNPVSLD